MSAMIDRTFPITENLLNGGLQMALRLLDLLINESDTLRERKDPNLLMTIAANKQDVVMQLETFTRQLGQVLATEKLNPSHAGIFDYLDRARTAGFETEKARDAWVNITAVSKKCRTLNEQNGASMELLIRNTQRALQILRGKSQLTSTYGPDGAARNELFSHTLVSV